MEQAQPALDEYITLRESSALQCSACFVILEMSGLAPLQEALDLAAGMHTEEPCIFLDLVEQERRRHRCDPRVDRYVTGTAHWIRGNLDWSFTSNRYGAGATPSGPQTFGE
ncbi:hypothetical protein ACFYZB_33805 [Streptomyces sp. NPDC001852]|uniref:hypothetical protein n=1 Tax=Streptomyces sp. NPDC001852 TaxID=3364619 RepID=UPI0036BF3EB8